MAILDKVLSWLSFCLAATAVVVSPWLFGSWEMWWFWPFAVCIFAAAFFLGFRLVIAGSTLRLHRISFPKSAIVSAVAFAVFLAYSFLRSLRAMVRMDAERSFMLFLTSFLLAAVIVVGFRRSQLRVFFTLIFLDLFLLGIYGIANHLLTNSRMVMWVVTEYTQYAGRATGSYFCPDHFSGIMELLLALSLGLLMTDWKEGLPPVIGRNARVWKFATLLPAAVALCGVWISQSRGGGLTVLAVLAVCGWIWTSRFRAPARLAVRLGGVAAFLVAVAVLWTSGNVYIDRFKELLPSDSSGGKSFAEAVEQAGQRIRSNIRYNMYAAALRAWRDGDPWSGIGPGMHQHLWFHYAATPDGDRERGIWPSRPSFEAHAHQVHNDWLQLLEEYGIAGTAVFLAFAVALLVCLLRGLRTGLAQPVVLGGLLSIAVMVLHSFVDFNLQMPATAWLFSASVAIPFAWCRRAGR